MKRFLSHMTMAPLGAVLFVFFLGQLAVASPNSRQLEKQIEKAVGHYYTQPFDITATDNGVVKIRGEVPVLYDRLRVFDIVAQVSGVREIKDEIIVNVPIVADKMIQANILEKISVNHAITEPERIKVDVDNGIVFLRGHVSFYREKLIANTIASWEKGVKGIEDEIQVAGKQTSMNDQELTSELMDILQQKFPHENNVSFSVQDGVVTLKGTTRTLWSEDQLIKGMSGLIGVQKVVSALKLAE